MESLSEMSAAFAALMPPEKLAEIQDFVNQHSCASPQVLARIKKSTDDTIELCKAKNHGLIETWKKAFDEKARAHQAGESKVKIEPELEEVARDVILKSAERLNKNFLEHITEICGQFDAAYTRDLIRRDEQFLRQMILTYHITDLKEMLKEKNQYDEEELQKVFGLKKELFQKEYSRRLVQGEMPAMKRLVENPFHKTVLDMFRGQEFLFEGTDDQFERFRTAMSQ